MHDQWLQHKPCEKGLVNSMLALGTIGQHAGLTLEAPFHKLVSELGSGVLSNCDSLQYSLSKYKKRLSILMRGIVEGWLQGACAMQCSKHNNLQTHTPTIRALNLQP